MIVERIAAELGLPVKFVHSIAAGASHEYKIYPIPKRTGGVRQICHPSRRLKALQRWLLRSIINKWPVHDAAMAYRSGSSIWSNAAVHLSSRYLIRMDCREFFPSITYDDIFHYLADHLALVAGWTVNDKDVFCKLVCRNRMLTIGAPTSPALSNAICFELDSKLYNLAENNGAKYTRYADDLFFRPSGKMYSRESRRRFQRYWAASRFPHIYS